MVFFWSFSKEQYRNKHIDREPIGPTLFHIVVTLECTVSDLHQALQPTAL